ncbi:MAG: hypothetical protein HC802_19185 [Caldilineaceae bacterium]|nr:hypothetical protein [Caldilineaceae bacterium]
MLVWPNHAGWATFGLDDLDRYRLQTRFIIAPGTPAGYGGLIIRFSDEANFYQLLADGEGRYQIQEQIEGEFLTVQPWTVTPSLYLAGNPNTLTVDDDGEEIRLLANETLLYSIPSAQLPSADVGIVGGATGEGAASISFEYVRVWSDSKVDED